MDRSGKDRKGECIESSWFQIHRLNAFNIAKNGALLEDELNLEYSSPLPLRKEIIDKPIPLRAWGAGAVQKVEKAQGSR